MEYGNSAFVVYYFATRNTRSFFNSDQKEEAEAHLSSLNLWENLVNIYKASDQYEGRTGQTEADIAMCLSYFNQARSALQIFKQIMNTALRQPPKALWELPKRQFFLFWMEFNALDEKDAIIEASIQAIALARNFISKKAFSTSRGFIFEENVDSFCSSSDHIITRRLIRRRVDFAAIGVIKDDLTVSFFKERPLFDNLFLMSLSEKESAHIQVLQKIYDNSFLMKGMEAEFMAKDTFGLVAVDPITRVLFFSPFCPQNDDGKDDVAFGRRCLIPATIRSWENWRKTGPGSCFCMRPGKGCFPLIRGAISSKAKLYGMDETVSYIREKIKVMRNPELTSEEKEKRTEELKIEHRNLLRLRSCREIGNLPELVEVFTREEIARARIKKFG